MRSPLGVSAIHGTIQTKDLLCLHALYCWMTGSLCLRSSQSSEGESYVNCGLPCNVISAGVCLFVPWMFLGPASLWVHMRSNSLTELEFHWFGPLSQNADPQPIISESLRSCSCSLTWAPHLPLDLLLDLSFLLLHILPKPCLLTLPRLLTMGATSLPNFSEPHHTWFWAQGKYCSLFWDTFCHLGMK